MVSKIIQQHILFLIGVTALIVSGCRNNNQEEAAAPTPVLPPVSPMCMVKSSSDSALPIRQEYIYENTRLVKVVEYNSDEKIGYKQFIYNDEGKKIRENAYTYQQDGDSLMGSYIIYAYNSVGQLITVSESSDYVFVGELFRSHVYVYDLKDRVVRLKQVQGKSKGSFMNLHLIYDEYDNIVEMRACPDESCEPYISYTYDYNLKAAPDSEYGFLLDAKPHHFIRRMTIYSESQKDGEWHYVPVNTDAEGKILKMVLYYDGTIQDTRTYAYECP